MTGAGIIFTDGEKLLLLKRAKGHNNAGTWDIPGGHSEKNESPLATAKREATEEIGNIQGTNLGCVIKNNFTTFIYKIDKPFDIKLNKEHDDYSWVNIDDIKVKLHPRININKYVAEIKKRFAKSFNEFVLWQDL